MIAINANFVEHYEAVAQLIIDDLKIHKHLNGLDNAGLGTDHLRLQIHESIFRLIGFKKAEMTESLSEWYFSKASAVYSIDIDDQHSLQGLAFEIFNGLLEKRENPENDNG